MCYYKLDYYDVSQEVLSVYLQHYPDSVTATNLKACNHFRLFNGKAAEQELKNLSEKTSHNLTYAEDLIKHNLVIFRGGEGALQILPPLVDVIPEARLNLVIYHMKKDDIAAAFNLMKDLEPSTPQEYILKGIVNAALGQEQESREHLKIAQQYFQLVGGSASECDTIPGRQCMASCFFLLKQFEDVLIYLTSIKVWSSTFLGAQFNVFICRVTFTMTTISITTMPKLKLLQGHMKKEKSSCFLSKAKSSSKSIHISLILLVVVCLAFIPL